MLSCSSDQLKKVAIVYFCFPPQATEALRITAPELIRLEVMDEVIPEPLGGAHSDPVAAFPAIKGAIMNTFRHYENMSEREIQLDRSVTDTTACRSLVSVVGVHAFLGLLMADSIVRTAEYLQWFRSSQGRV